MSREDWEKNTIPAIMTQMGYNIHAMKIKSVLDVGCGLSFKAQFIPDCTRVAFDVYRPYLEAIPENLEFGQQYIPIQGDARDLSRIFLPNSFDMVIATDILEHLEKHEGHQLLRNIMRISKHLVFIETPQGYIPQNIDIWGKGGHEWQTHRSEWQSEELEELGFDVLCREYQMSDAKRHTDIDDIDDIDRDIVLMDGVHVACGF